MGVSKRVALVDNVLRDLRYACRSFLRTPLVALTIVSTVGLGLGLVAVVFTILNGFAFHADEVRNPAELFAVQHPPSADATPRGFTRIESLLVGIGFRSDAGVARGVGETSADGLVEREAFASPGRR
jgi:hypothetical protein